MHAVYFPMKSTWLNKIIIIIVYCQMIPLLMINESAKHLIWVMRSFVCLKSKTATTTTTARRQWKERNKGKCKIIFLHCGHRTRLHWMKNVCDIYLNESKTTDVANINKWKKRQSTLSGMAKVDKSIQIFLLHRVFNQNFSENSSYADESWHSIMAYDKIGYLYSIFTKIVMWYTTYAIFVDVM